jgi:hypothetical protein
MTAWDIVSPQAARMPDDTRDKWAADLVEFVRGGDEAAYVACLSA